MDNNEKLGLIERVDHASEEQAKRTLKFMILKCNVKTDTIARAIRDALERHAPTPTIVYQQPESEDDDEAALASSHRKSKRKKKKKERRHDGSSEIEENARLAGSSDHQNAPLDAVDTEPDEEQLILKKTKTKTKSKQKAGLNDDQDEQQNSSEPKKRKRKHACKHRAETEQHAHEPLGSPTKQNDPTVIDLITSSDDETCDRKQSKNASLDGKSSNVNNSDNVSPDESSSDGDKSSDNGGSGDKPPGDAFADGSGPSPESSNKKANQASTTSGDVDHSAVRSSTHSTAKTSNQNDGFEISLFGSGKKRKAPDRTVEEVHNDQPGKSRTIPHINKKPKQNHTLDSQRSSEDQICRKCGILFPSVPELRKHQHHCKGFSATLSSHHRSDPPSEDHSRSLKHTQKASHPAGQSFTDEPHNTLRLPSRPRERSPADPGLSVPPSSSVQELENFPSGPKYTSRALARSVSGIQSSPSGLVNGQGPKLSADGSPDHQSRPPKRDSSIERLIPEREKIVYQCKYCKKSFTEYGNAVGACKFHRGAYSPLFEISRESCLIVL